MDNQEVRWVQRLEHFSQALKKLTAAVHLAEQRPLSDLEKQGLIQGFEYTHELAWNTMRDFLREKGVQNLYGSKDSTREAFKQGLISAGETWMEMIRDRNLTSHTYNEEIADKINNAITGSYAVLFTAFLETMEKIRAEESA